MLLSSIKNSIDIHHHQIPKTMLMALIISCIFIITPLIFLLQILNSKMKKNPINNNNNRLPSPPGPKSLPILGNLHMIGKNTVHKDLYNLSKKYGSIMSMKLGFVPTIIVSSPEAAEKFLKTHDLFFASRPHHEASWHIAYKQKNMTFSPYGNYWRKMRRLCNQELLSSHKVNFFRSTRRQEVDFLVRSLIRASSNGDDVDLTNAISSAVANLSCMMIFGKKCLDIKHFDDNRGFKDVIQETMRLAAVPNFGDFFPLLGFLDLQGLNRRLKALSKVFDDFLEKIIDEQRLQEKPINTNFVDTMMAFLQSGEADFEFDIRHVKSILLDLLIASVDTSTIAIEWTLSELFRNPHAMQKLQNELKQKIGMQRPVEESDLDDGKGGSGLEYLDMVVKESLRLHPVAPLLVREAMKDCTVEGYHIKKKSRVVINLWAIMRNPKVWSSSSELESPEKFFPERFEGGNDIDVKGQQDFRLIPFGAGRRSCPGLQLGLVIVRLVVAQLVHCFDWKVPNDDLDMSEVFGLLTGRAKHLRAVPVYRLQK